MHSKSRVADGCVFEDANWGKTVGPAAAGEGGIVEGEADVEGDDGVEAEGFVHCVLGVLEL